jgi:flagellar biosynthesis chaperone FliJ
VYRESVSGTAIPMGIPGLMTSQNEIKSRLASQSLDKMIRRRGGILTVRRLVLTTLLMVAWICIVMGASVHPNPTSSASPRRWRRSADVDLNNDSDRGELDASGYNFVTLSSVLGLCNWAGLLYIGTRMFQRSRQEESNKQTYDLALKSLASEVQRIKTQQLDPAASLPFDQKLTVLESALLDNKLLMERQSASLDELSFSLVNLESRLQETENIVATLKEDNDTTTKSHYADTVKRLETQLQDTRNDVTRVSEAVEKTRQDIIEVGLDFNKFQAVDLKELLEKREEDLLKKVRMRTNSALKKNPSKRNNES